LRRLDRGIARRAVVVHCLGRVRVGGTHIVHDTGYRARGGADPPADDVIRCAAACSGIRGAL